MPRSFRFGLSLASIFVLCTRDAPKGLLWDSGWFSWRRNRAALLSLALAPVAFPAAIQDGEGGWLIEPNDRQKLTEIIR